jgi:hypothetical protein
MSEENLQKEPHNVITSDTENASRVEPKDAPPHKRKKFEKFRAYNTGMWNGPKRENTEQFRHQDNLHRFDSISSTLCLTDYQKSRGRSLMVNFDFQDIGHSIDHVLFALCVLLVNDDIGSGCRYYPLPSAPGDAEFESLADELGLSPGKQDSMIEKIRNITDF